VVEVSLVDSTTTGPTWTRLVIARDTMRMQGIYEGDIWRWGTWVGRWSHRAEGDEMWKDTGRKKTTLLAGSVRPVLRPGKEERRDSVSWARRRKVQDRVWMRDIIGLQCLHPGADEVSSIQVTSERSV
jgi:hypothetical protein